MAKKKAAPMGIDGDAFLAAQLAEPAFRQAFEQRRLIHEVALAVKGMRLAAGLTQAQLAKRIQSNQPMIARIEKGLDQRTPQFDTLQRIAGALGRQLKLVFVMPTKKTKTSIVEVETSARRTRKRSSEAQAAAE
ncbi:MAG TPA: helix-turn-helix transcriptional regulator [Myxococcales bacterium]|jgi:transcriptional regulator with XRE-family HTH domain|nr:helix-turn-helix transcriptional regulator [Myxococcales bacterium]